MKSTFFSSRPLSSDFGLLLLRLISGGVILTHGLPKLQKILAGNFQFADPIGLGAEASLYFSAFAEVICALLVVLGLLSRIALIPLLINLSVAFFIFHAADNFAIKELPLLFLGMFLVLFFTGPGRFSIDSRLGKRR
jgi:putative oxidoreductase